MSNWTAHFRPGVLKRSPAYQSFLEENRKQFKDQLRRQNWKAEQIALLKKNQKGLNEPMGTGVRSSGATVESPGNKQENTLSLDRD